MGRFIYIAGADGTGKSTQARLLIQHLERDKIRCRNLWLRFPFFFSLPMLGYARIRGYSWREDVNGTRHGYWDFRRSWCLRNVLPWIVCLDTLLASLRKVYLPLWFGETIVCERYIIDIMVDLAVALDDPVFHRRLPGRLLWRIIPRDSLMIVLVLGAESIRRRRPQLVGDWRLNDRLDAFRRIGEYKSLVFVSSASQVSEVGDRILELLEDWGG